MKPIRLLRGFLTVGGWTLMSRILGFLREILILAFIGPGPMMDAFVAAFRLPNMFRRFFAEGAFNAAFVPMFSKRLEAGENAEGFARDALGLLSACVLGLIALAMICMPAFVYATANGFVGDARFELTVGFGRIVFPYIFFMSLGALFSAVLNATGRFAAAAAAPVLLNILAISAMLCGYMLGQDVIYWLLWAIPVSGFAQLLLLWISVKKAGFNLTPKRPRLSPEMRRMVVIAVPAALASGVLQINLLVGQLVASSTPSALSWLYAADRLYQLPLGVVGIAIGVVLLPSLSRHLKSGDTNASRDALSRAAEFALVLTLPASIALIVIPTPLVNALFQRGATGVDDAAAIALACAIYGLGLPAFVLQKVLQPIFFAREDTKSPFRFAVVAMLVNAAVALIGGIWLGWIAAAVAATLAAWTQVVLLVLKARGLGDIARFDERFHARIWRIIAASIAMGAILWLVKWALSPMLDQAGLRAIGLLILVASGAASFFAIAHVIGAVSLGDFTARFRRRRP